MSAEIHHQGKKINHSDRFICSAQAHDAKQPRAEAGRKNSSVGQCKQFKNFMPEPTMQTRHFNVLLSQGTLLSGFLPLTPSP